MFRRLLAIGLLASGLGLPSAALADTGYTPAQNTVVNVTAPLPLPNVGTGDLTLAAQEALYGVTGLSVPHDYVIVAVNGQGVLALDPLVIYGK
jgi:hypothetical protein